MGCLYLYILNNPTLFMETIKCDLCEKVLEGYSVKQVEYLLAQHKLAKHSDVSHTEFLHNKRNKTYKKRIDGNKRIAESERKSN